MQAAHVAERQVAAAGAVGHMELWDAGGQVAGARLRHLYSGGWKPLSRCAVIAMAERTQEVAPQGSAFGALARTDRRTRGAPFDRSRGASLEQRLTGGLSVCQNRAEKPRPPSDGKTQTPVKQPTPPLPTGSGAHGLRGQVNALAGVLASKHALAECGPNASAMKAAAAEVAHAGGPRCRTPGCGCRCCRARGTLGRRTPCRRRAPQAPVKWWVETLSRYAVIAMRPSAPGRLQGSRSWRDRASSARPHSGKLSEDQGKAGPVPPGQSALRK